MRICFARAAGKAGLESTSLNARWGSGVMMQMRECADLSSVCGSRILPGFSRFWSTMCFLVVSCSHIGSAVASSSSSDSPSAAASRFFFPVLASFLLASDLMCLISDPEALKTCQAVSQLIRAPPRERKEKKRVKIPGPGRACTVSPKIPWREIQLSPVPYLASAIVQHEYSASRHELKEEQLKQ